MSRPLPSPPGDRSLLADARQVSVASDTDIVAARQQARDLAIGLGFSASEAIIVATAVSELARNIVDYATSGEVILNAVECGTRRGIVVIAQDRGPGIADVGLAMRDGFSTAGRLGLGLPGARRLMDDFEIVSEVGKGTRVMAKKWTG